MNLTIKSRLAILSLVGILSVVAMGLAGYLGSRNIGAGNEAVKVTAQALQNHMDSDMMHDAIRADVISSLVAETDEDKTTVTADLEEHVGRFNENVAANSALPLKPEVKDAIEGVTGELNVYVTSAQDHVKIAFSDKAAAKARYGEFKDAFESLEVKMEEVSGEIEKSIEAAKDLQSGAIANFRRNLLIVLIIASIILAALSIWIARGITTPINSLVSVVTDISEGAGDLTVRIPIERSDEIGQLAARFNKFVEKVQGIVRDISVNTGTLSTASSSMAQTSQELMNDSQNVFQNSKSASGATSKASQSIREIASGIGNVSEGIGDVASGCGEVSRNLESVSAAVEEMSVNMTTIATAVDGMSTSVNTVASAVEEMSASLREVSDNTTKAAELSSAVSQEAGDTAQTVNTLGDASKNIGRVVDLIRGIAAQTNLLALNATIEAASAGEAGKGFAVVANEVKELARQTSKATEDISTEIQAIQRSTGQSVDAIRHISESVKELNGAFTMIASAIREQTLAVGEITSNVGGAAKGVEEVARNVQEAAIGAREISKNVQQANSRTMEIAKRSGDVADAAKRGAANADSASRGIDDAAKNVATMLESTQASRQRAESMSASAKELQNLSLRLKQIVGQFTV
jgi:methyl-accepting chemotaxis protein